MSTVSPYSQHNFAVGRDNDSFSNLFDFVPANARVLDVGCSTGNFALALLELKGCTVVGVDVSESDIAEAKTKFADAYVLDATDAEALKALGTFDVVVFADVLEHLVDPRGALRVVRDILNPGGIVLFSIPHMAHLSVRLDLVEGVFPYTETGLLDNTHIHFYDRHEVETLFDDAGFTITAEKPVVIEYPAAWIAERLEALGLASNPAFNALLERSEANVFQFVGVAAPTDDLADARTSIRIRTSPLNEIRTYAAEAIASSEQANARAGDLEARLNALRRENKQLAGNLADVKRSTSWRVTRPLRALSRLRGKKRS